MTTRTGCILLQVLRVFIRIGEPMTFLPTVLAGLASADSKGETGIVPAGVGVRQAPKPVKSFCGGGGRGRLVVVPAAAKGRLD